MNLFDLAKAGEQPLLPVTLEDNYFSDLNEYYKANPVETIPPDPTSFSKDTLAAMPDHEWLNTVNIDLIYPQGKTLEEHRFELCQFKEKLLGELNHIPQALCPKFPEGFNEPVLALDTENTGLDVRVRYVDQKLVTRTLLVGLCLASSGEQAYYLPVRHTEEDGIPNWNHQAMIELIDDLHGKCVILYSNAAYDREVLLLNGCRVQRPFPYFFDDQILDFLTDVNNKRHGLKPVSERKLNRKMVEIQELFTGMGSKKSKSTYITFDKLPAVNAYVYGASDALNTYKLFEVFATEKKNNVLLNQPIPLELDHKMVDTSRCMCRPGMPINLRYFYYAALDTIQRFHATEEFIYKLVGHPIELGSPQQLAKLLFTELEIPKLKNHKIGKSLVPSTDGDTLDELFKLHPDVLQLRYIVFWRKLNNSLVKMFNNCLVNSYVDEVLPYTKVQLSFSQTNVPTGRLSSSSSDGAERATLSIAKKTGRKKYVYHSGSWDCGFNSQGVSSDPYKLKACKKVTKLPDWAGINFDDFYSVEVRDLFKRGLAEV